jgi:hypothetical protein
MYNFISIINKSKIYSNYFSYLKYKNKIKNYGKFETIDFVPKLNYNNSKQKIKITTYPKSKVPYKDQYENRDF